MAIYKEIDGKLVLVEEDTAQNTVHEQIQAQRLEAGQEISSCIKDSLAPASNKGDN